MPEKGQTNAQPIEAAAITYGLQDAVRLTGLSRRTLYNLHERGQLPFVKVCGRTLVRRTDLERLLGGEA